MFSVDKDGRVLDRRIRASITPAIEGPPLKIIQGIIVHQTDSSTATSTLASYGRPKPNGAHFLIDKDGTIYQTASLLRQTRHVGPIKSMCFETHSCSPVDLAAVLAARKSKSPGQGALKEHRLEMAKPLLDRYPSNEDSIGVEIVGKANGLKNKEVYETVNAAQNAALKWLVGELSATFDVPINRVFRHPQISRKNITEASTAIWK